MVAVPQTRFLFLRHGQTDWNLEGRFQGHADVMLNDTGLRQAQEAAAVLADHPIDRIVSSPLIRALKTAAIVAERTGLALHIDDQLKERGFGSVDGEVVADVKRRHGIPVDQFSLAMLPPDAEAWSDTLLRARTVIGRWLARVPEETILFVAHDGIYRALCETLLEAPASSRHGAPYEFVPGERKWMVSPIG